MRSFLAALMRSVVSTVYGMRAFLAALAISAVFAGVGLANYRAPVMHVLPGTYIPPKLFQDHVINRVYPPNVFPDAKPVKTESFKPKPTVVKVSKAKPRAKRQRHYRRHAHRSTRYARSE